jgi:type IV secretion system protein VirB1
MPRGSPACRPRRSAAALTADPQPRARVVDLPSLLMACAPLVHPATASALIDVESSRNPHAIGVVAGSLIRQPSTQSEAIATAKHLRASGWNYSAGLAQINQRNFTRLGLDDRSVFEPCKNLAAMQAILLECFDRAKHRAHGVQHGLQGALSCYYSGNFVTGFEHGYVHKVVQASRNGWESKR